MSAPGELVELGPIPAPAEDIEMDRPLFSTAVVSMRGSRNFISSTFSVTAIRPSLVELESARPRRRSSVQFRHEQGVDYEHVNISIGRSTSPVPITDE